MATTAAVAQANAETQARAKARQLGGRGELFKALLLVGVPVAAFFFGRAWYDESYYNAEEGLGYWLGLVGGVLMLLAYGYSARKRIPGLRHVSKLIGWLRIHIFFGIVGPYLILPHTTFQFKSQNGLVAFVAMSCVFLSGVVGRYLYSKVHFGLDGKKAELLELTESLGLNDQDRRSVLAAIEPVRVRLTEYQQLVVAQEHGVLPAFKALVVTRFGGHALYWKMSRELRSYLAPIAQQSGWSAADLDIAQRQLRLIIRDYIRALIRVSQFKAYDQLFMLWRMVHVPLLYLLFISGVFHVLYVHMY